MKRKIDPKKMPFGSNIKALRTALGLNQRAFAKKINVSQPQISSWETGKSLPNLQEVMLICYKCHISADVLLGIPKDWKNIK